MQRHLAAGSNIQICSFLGIMKLQAGSHQYLQKAQNLALLRLIAVQLILSDATFQIYCSDMYMADSDM